MAEIEIQLSHPVRNVGEQDDRVKLDETDARLLVRAGVARYATVPEAKKAGADPGSAASQQKD